MYIIVRTNKETGKEEYRGYDGHVVWTEQILPCTVKYGKLKHVQYELKRQCRDKRYDFNVEVVDARH